ncbi:MAG: transpeptidase family protein [Treponema sp.]|nr:transpeptidase family protein [Treponema sp.]
MNKFYKKGWLIFFFTCFGGCIVAIMISYFQLSLLPVANKTVNPPEIERGSIVDRSGFPLAVQTTFYRIGINTKDIKDKELFSTALAPVLDMSYEELFEKIDKKREYIILKKKSTADEADLIRSVADDYKIANINFEKIPGRIYPNYALASQLIGYMGDEGKGLAGIEFSQQSVLLPEINLDAEKQEQGKNVYLTIDANLQYKLEQIAYKSMETTQAESMMILAADCKTGEILSYISLPAADLNEYGTAPAESKINRPAINAYEPGSVFKIFTVALAYDSKGISPTDSFLCDGAYEKRLASGEVVRIKCLDHHGYCTPREALKYSCNDVLGQISDRMKDQDFIDRIRLLGFGEKTGIELSGETTGFVKNPDNRSWSARSKPTIAIGQEISVSALQMVQAATAIANRGIPVKLSVINKITDRDGVVVYEHTPEYKERVLKPETADFILSCMETTATTGTGSRANIGDVKLGVKTGTAQMADKINGGYSDTDFLSNCISIFPIDDPQIILYIVVEKAKGETYAGRIVAPVIGETASVIIDHMGMSRGSASSVAHNGKITIPTKTQITIGSELPDFTGRSKRELLPLLDQQNVKLNINGSGWVTSQTPEPGTPVTENMTIELYLE